MVRGGRQEKGRQQRGGGRGNPPPRGRTRPDRDPDLDTEPDEIPF
jgi:hypothetical protein